MTQPRPGPRQALRCAADSLAVTDSLPSPTPSRSLVVCRVEDLEAAAGGAATRSLAGCCCCYSLQLALALALVLALALTPALTLVLAPALALVLALALSLALALVVLTIIGRPPRPEAAAEHRGAAAQDETARAQQERGDAGLGVGGRSQHHLLLLSVLRQHLMQSSR